MEVLDFFFKRGSFSLLVTGHTAAGAHELYLNMDEERLKLLWEQEQEKELISNRACDTA